jgi:opacity protein-like surface antigen
MKKFFKYMMVSTLGVTTCVSSLSAGFYAGGSLGLGLFTGDHKYTIPATGEGITHVKGIGPLIGAHGGYTHLIGGGITFVGAELFGLMGTGNATGDVKVTGGPLNGKVKARRKITLGAAVLAGTFINPKVGLYAKIGFERNSYKFEYRELTFQTPNTENRSKSTLGFAPGAGVIFRLAPSVAIAAEYTYAMGKKMIIRSDTTASQGATRGFFFTPSEQRLLVKLSYMFG